MLEIWRFSAFRCQIPTVNCAHHTRTIERESQNTMNRAQSLKNSNKHTDPKAF